MKKRITKKVANLTNYEQNILLPVLMNGLTMKIGEINAVTSKQIVSSLRRKGLKISTCSVCKIINHIRTNDLIVGLMASYSGYYISSCGQDLVRYEDALLSREKAIKKVRMSIKRQREFFISQNTEKEVQLF